jgi:chemotaxis protein methyltransferase CheR
MLDIKENEFKKLTGYIKQKYGINLTKKKNLIEGRLSNLIIEKGFKSFKEYLDYTFSDKTGAEETILLNRLTTNHTFFMRESSHFEYYENNVLPGIVNNLKENDLRIWSAGCSTGEEPYTLAMINNDFFGEKKHLYDTKILATDISVKALKSAEEGKYPKEALNNLPTVWKLKYFYKDSADDRYGISDEIKNDVIFRVFNLMDEVFPFKRRFHVIFCRNVMIYFDQQTKNKLINKFYELTEPGGYLFIGHSESISREITNYKYIMPAVYQKE